MTVDEQIIQAIELTAEQREHEHRIVSIQHQLNRLKLAIVRAKFPDDCSDGDVFVCMDYAFTYRTPRGVDEWMLEIRKLTK